MGKAGVKSKKSEVAAFTAEDDHQLANLELAVEQLERALESYTFFEDIGWELPGAAGGDRGPDLVKLKTWAKHNRRLAALDPLIRKAILTRIAYLFGEGVQFGEHGKDMEPRCKDFLAEYADSLFSEEAFAQMESALNTDGQYFFLLEKRSNKRLVTRVPLSEISDIAQKQGDVEKTLFIKRTWVQTKQNGKVDSVDDIVSGSHTEEVSEWYPAYEHDSKIASKQAEIGGVKVNHNAVMLRVSANKQIGWTWGIGDVQPGKAHAGYYKEFLDSQFVLLKSLAQFTWKTSTATAKGAKTAATKMAAVPSRGPDGKPLNIGQAFNGGGGGDIAAINKAGANIDFGAGRPLAVMAVAGLGLSIHHVLPEKGEAGDDTLDIATLKTMGDRQKLHKKTFEKIFKYFRLDIKVDFAPIQSEPIHRTVQAIVAALGTNLLFPEEGRELVLSALHPLGLEPKKGLPKAGSWITFLGTQPNENPGTSPIQNKDQSNPKKRSPAGPTSDGDHEMRPSEAWTAELVKLISERVTKAVLAQK